MRLVTLIILGIVVPNLLKPQHINGPPTQVQTCSDKCVEKYQLCLIDLSLTRLLVFLLLLGQEELHLQYIY